MAENGDKRDVTVKVVLDLILLFLVPQISLLFLLVIDPFHRGFFCDDESITYPYKPNTVSTMTVGIVGVSVPCIVMTVTELIYYKNQLRGISFKDSASMSRYRMCGKTIHPYLTALYTTWGPFLFGCAVTLTCTDLGKYSIGRLRPHFLTVCEPDWSSFNCTDDKGSMLYITDPSVCKGDPDLIEEARVSHPSGHSSFAVYALVYLVMYMEVRLIWKGSKLLRHFIQVAVLYLAVWVCCSRISDYQHHWSDVLGGSVLGASVALITFYYHTQSNRKCEYGFTGKYCEELCIQRASVCLTAYDLEDRLDFATIVWLYQNSEPENLFQAYFLSGLFTPHLPREKSIDTALDNISAANVQVKVPPAEGLEGTNSGNALYL